MATPADRTTVRRRAALGLTWVGIPRVALLAAAGSLIAGVVAVRSVFPAPSETATVRHPATVAVAPSPASEARVLRLHDLSRSRPAPLLQRNPFAYRRPTEAAGALEPPDRASGAQQLVTDAVERLMPRLIGIAEDVEGGIAVRIAIITLPDQLFVVGEGDALGSQYRVSAIVGEGAELFDVVTGERRRLTFR
jgi:hypothetical protein